MTQDNDVNIFQVIGENIMMARMNGWPLPAFRINRDAGDEIIMFGALDLMEFPLVFTGRFIFAGCGFRYDPSLGDGGGIDLRVYHWHTSGNRLEVASAKD